MRFQHFPGGTDAFVGVSQGRAGDALGVGFKIRCIELQNQLVRVIPAAVAGFKMADNRHFQLDQIDAFNSHTFLLLDRLLGSGINAAGSGAGE